MKDLHCHICYGIDDGPKTLEESIKMLEYMAKCGFTDVFATPHYMEDSKYIATNTQKNKILKKLQEVIKDRNLNLNLYCGNEIYISNNILEMIKNKKIMTLNNSRYLLIEFSLFYKNPNIRSILYELLRNGYVPIIAHPERYVYLDKDFTLIKELKDLGCLFQGNYPSLFGKYGKTAKKNLTKMIKQGIISFLGSDIHCIEELYIEKLPKKLKRIVKSDDIVENLLYNNINKVINNEEI